MSHCVDRFFLFEGLTVLPWFGGRGGGGRQVAPCCHGFWTGSTASVLGSHADFCPHLIVNLFEWRDVISRVASFPCHLHCKHLTHNGVFVTLLAVAVVMLTFI